MSTLTPNYNLIKPELTDSIPLTVGNDLGANFAIIDSAMNTTNNKVNQLDYQDATVVGTQIRLVKNTDLKTLKFKLSALVTGGAITISTDGGTTSKPLVEVDGITAVTELEVGFYEVIADATFFTLRASGGGSNIKSIQRGNLTFGSSLSFLDVDITPVDLSKAIIIINYVPTYGSASRDTVGVKFVDSDTFRIQRASSGGTIDKFSWQVVEFDNVKTLQSGENAFGSGQLNINVNQVELSKTMVFHSHRASVNDTTPLFMKINSYLSSDTNLVFDRTGNSGDIQAVNWFLVEFN